MEDWEALPVRPPKDPAKRDKMALDALGSIARDEQIGSWSDELEAIYAVIEWAGRKTDPYEAS